MASIYDDIDYIETIQNIKYENELDNNSKYENRDTESVRYEDKYEINTIKIIELIQRKKMFEKCLEETLRELNKTNPCLEAGKYHMLCIYTIRYYRFINQIENKILWYEWENMEIKNKKLYGTWHWSWKLMSYFKYTKTYGVIPEKNTIEKKKD